MNDWRASQDWMGGLHAEPAAPSLPALLLLPAALVTSLSAYTRFGALELWLGFVLGVWWAIVLLRRFSIVRAAAPASVWSVLAAIVLIALCFAPVVRLPIAPGADQAMYSTIARGMTDGLEGLSPAWGNIDPQLYPRGYPLLLATLAPIAGVPAASLLSAGIALAMFAVALGHLFRTLGLGRYSFPFAVSLALVCRVPQFFFGSGTNATVLALAWGLTASAHAIRAGRNEPAASVHLTIAILCALAGLVTHPIGAIAGLGGGVVGMVLQISKIRWPRVALFGMAVLLGAMMLQVFGPGVSASELAWIQRWIRETEGVLRPWSFDVRGMVVGLPYGYGLVALSLIVAGILLGLRDRTVRPLSVMACLAGIGFLVLEAVGPSTPVLRSVVYPYRLLPGLAILQALPGFAWLSARPQRLQQRALGIFLAVGVALNWHYYQSATPMASASDLSSITCLDATVPAGEAIDGAYGDATQWIPALTGRQVTEPHVHITLQDEYDAQDAATPLTVRYRFVGSILRYWRANNDSAGTKPLCRRDQARLLELSAPIIR